MTTVAHKRMNKRFFWDSITRELLLDAYENQVLTLEEIGVLYGVSGHTIRNAMRHFGITMRGAWETRKKRGSPFFRLSRDELKQLYCDVGLSAREIAERFGVGQTSVLRYLATYCIPIRIPRDGHGWTWKGKKKHRGYVQILLASDDPMYSMADQRGYVLEHRLVMARHLGRPLLRSEIVHHRPDVAKDDNRIEVLYLMPNPSDHSKLSPCSSCELKREIRLLHWQIKEQSEQIQNLTRALSGLNG